jgi:HD-GYP domain-containing protein (c-di-GMP phosphodiesterase class II)
MDSVNWNISDEVYKETEFFTAGPFYEYIGTISHAELGYYLIKKFNPFVKIAEIVRYHDIHWKHGEGKYFKGKKVPLGSHIIHLAGNIDILINQKNNEEEDILTQSTLICEKIQQDVGKRFSPELVEVFLSLAEKEAFWFGLVSSGIDRELSKRVEGVNLELNYEGLLSLANLFSQIIDFRNRFTATHSSGVAASAEVLAKLVGLSEFKCRQIKIAGYLHDLGKLAVSPEILNKGGKLTRKEFDIIKRHPFYTYKILDRVKGLEEIKIWASYHHERVDGQGYPFHTKGEKLPIEARIMAVADVFTALTEDRPYRKGMTLQEALSILEEMSNNGALDTAIVSILKENFEEIDRFRVKAQTTKAAEYESFWQEIE